MALMGERGTASQGFDPCIRQDVVYQNSISAISSAIVDLDPLDISLLRCDGIVRSPLPGE